MTDYVVHTLDRLQSLTARSMKHAIREGAQVTFHTECDVTALVEAIKSSPEGTASFSTHVIYALLRTLEAHPHFNAHLTEDEICVYQKIKLGMVIYTGHGILVGCLPDAASKTLDELDEELKTLQDRALDRDFHVSETRGATFMVTDLSDYPVDAFTPILLPSAIAMLGIGRTRRVCLPTEKGCQPAHLLSLSLTFDHRGTDGIAAGQFLYTLLDCLGVS